MVKTRDLNKLDVNFHYPRFGKKLKNIVGWDTETIDGKCRIITLSTSEKEEIYHINSKEDWINLLTQKRFQRSLNFFWNLNYDVNSMLKYFSKEKLLNLHYFDNISEKKINFSYLKHKNFCIRKKGEKRNSNYYFWDIAQFFDMIPLKLAAKKYLNLDKKEYDVINLKEEDLKKEKLIEYAKTDAKLCRLLAKYFYIYLKNLKLFGNKPYSKASLTKEFYWNKYDSFPYLQKEKGLDNENNLNYLWQYSLNNYYGGRFEVLKRGYLTAKNEYLNNPKIFYYDLNSCYPNVIKNLLDLRYGIWNFEIKEPKNDAFYSICRCQFNQNFEKIGLYPQEKNNLIYYPKSIKNDVYLNNFEIDFFKKIGIDFKIINGFYFYPLEKRKVFSYLEDLYAYRNLLKSQKNDLQITIKIIMNSLYGSLIELQKTEKEGENIEDCDKIIRIQNELIGFKTRFRCGYMFNPFYGSLITSIPKLQLLEESLKIPESVVSYATDSIVSLEKIPGIKISNNLGDWSLEGEGGEGIVIGSGMYEIRFDDSNVKIRLRSFSFAKSKDSIFEKLEKNPEKDYIKMNTKKLISLNEALFKKKVLRKKIDFSDYNKIYTIEKILYINSDIKRNWEKNFDNNAEVLKKLHVSKPL